MPVTVVHDLPWQKQYLLVNQATDRRRFGLLPQISTVCWTAFATVVKFDLNIFWIAAFATAGMSYATQLEIPEHEE